MAISNLFSRRRKIAQGGFPDVYQYTLIPHTFRVQITHIWADTLNKGAYPDEVYFRIVQSLRREYGTYQLVKDTYNPNDKSEANHELGKFFLNETSVEKCLDVIELSLQYIDTVCRNPQYTRLLPNLIRERKNTESDINTPMVNYCGLTLN